ncbi:MAG: CoxG family protein [Gammaproteobacteria bacterium]
MHIGGEVLLHADPQTVWRALHDTNLLAQCVPGCEEINWCDDETLTASLVLKIGTARRRYRGHIRIVEAIEPESYRLLIGKSVETASIESRIRLEPTPAGTTIHYEIEASLDGYLERLGARIAAGIARRLATRFFKRLDVLLQEKPD